jgi:hypothetical protein
VITPAESTDAISGLKDLQVSRPTTAGVPSSRTARGVTRILSPEKMLTEPGSRINAEATERARAGSPGALPVMRIAIEARLP